MKVNVRGIKKTDRHQLKTIERVLIRLGRRVAQLTREVEALHDQFYTLEERVRACKVCGNVPHGRVPSLRRGEYIIRCTGCGSPMKTRSRAR